MVTCPFYRAYGLTGYQSRAVSKLRSGLCKRALAFARVEAVLPSRLYF